MEDPAMSNIIQSGIETQSGSLVTVRGEGETTQEAAKDLLRHLLFEAGWVVDNWHRHILDPAIAEIRDFLNGSSQAGKADFMQ
jgi:hypothetical protein